MLMNGTTVPLRSTRSGFSGIKWDVLKGAELASETQLMHVAQAGAGYSPQFGPFRTSSGASWLNSSLASVRSTQYVPHN
jgi:hypothetical protein